MLHEIMATPPAAQAGQDGSLDMATRVPLGTTGIVVTQSVRATLTTHCRWWSDCTLDAVDAARKRRITAQALPPTVHPAAVHSNARHETLRGSQRSCRLTM